RDTLKPVNALSDETILSLIGKLDHEDFRVRNEATKELESIADLAEEFLRRKLSANPSQEARRRILFLLEKVDPSNSWQKVQQLRAIEVLEYIGTREAQEALVKLSKGASASFLTREAKASLKRMGSKKRDTME